MGKDVDVAIAPIVGALGRIQAIKKCAGCECFLSVVEVVEQHLAGGIDSAARLHAWFEYGQQRRHGCLGCAVCFPAEPYNRFMAAMRGVKSQEAAARCEECAADTVIPQPGIK
jgi:hypothetical protein